MPTSLMSFLAVHRQLNRSLGHLLILSNTRDLWPLRHLIRVKRRHDLTQKDLHLKTVKTIQVTCDNWDTDYNYYNWEPKFMTIFVTWQSRVTVDSIRNSCDTLGLVTWLRSCLPITLIKFLKGHKCLGLLFNVEIKRCLTQSLSQWSVSESKCVSTI